MTKFATADVYANNSAHNSSLPCIAVGSIRSRQLLAPPFSGLLVKHHYVAMAKYKGLLMSKWGAAAGV